MLQAGTISLFLAGCAPSTNTNPPDTDPDSGVILDSDLVPDGDQVRPDGGDHEVDSPDGGGDSDIDVDADGDSDIDADGDADIDADSDGMPGVCDGYGEGRATTLWNLPDRCSYVVDMDVIRGRLIGICGPDRIDPSRGSNILFACEEGEGECERIGQVGNTVDVEASESLRVFPEQIFEMSGYICVLSSTDPYYIIDRVTLPDGSIEPRFFGDGIDCFDLDAEIAPVLTSPLGSYIINSGGGRSVEHVLQPNSAQYIPLPGSEIWEGVLFVAHENRYPGIRESSDFADYSSGYYKIRGGLRMLPFTLNDAGDLVVSTLGEGIFPFTTNGRNAGQLSALGDSLVVVNRFSPEGLPDRLPAGEFRGSSLQFYRINESGYPVHDRNLEIGEGISLLMQPEFAITSDERTGILATRPPSRDLYLVDLTTRTLIGDPVSIAPVDFTSVDLTISEHGGTRIVGLLSAGLDNVAVLQTLALVTLDEGWQENLGYQPWSVAADTGIIESGMIFVAVGEACDTEEPAVIGVSVE